MSGIEARQRDHAIKVNTEMAVALAKARDDLNRIVGAIVHVGGMKLLTDVATTALNIRNAERTTPQPTDSGKGE